MPKETTHQGASGLPAEPRQERAFPDPSTIAQQAVDNGGENGDHTQERPMSDRDLVMSDIEARIDAERSASIAEQMREYAESVGKTPEQLEAERQAEEQLESEGLESREQLQPEQKPASRRDELPEEYADDPLADYIVMDEDNNRPMFVTKIDGKEQYIPLEQARRQIQKQEAADARLKKAAERQKELDKREEEIARQEAALAQRLQVPAPAEVSSPSEPAPDVSDQDLLNEAQQFVENMFNNSPDEATASLAQLLGNMRHLQNKPAPQVDPEELARTTAALVRAQQIDAEKQKDATDGLQQFTDSYPDIMANRALYLYADDMTDSIAEEWNIEGRSFTDSEVMMEAGKRTMEWVAEMKGTKPGGETPSEDPTPNNDRRERKRNLRPMPKARSQALQNQEPVEEAQTPGDVVAEMRKARGQG